jgi:hypothetical protein
MASVPSSMIDRGGSGAGGGAGGLSGTAMPDGDGGEAESKGEKLPKRPVPTVSSSSSSSSSSSGVSSSFDFSQSKSPKFEIPWDQKIVAIAADHFQPHRTATRVFANWCDKKGKPFYALMNPGQTGFGVSHSQVHPNRLIIFYHLHMDDLNRRLAEVDLKATPIRPDVVSGTIGPIRDFNSADLLQILYQATPSLVLHRRSESIPMSDGRPPCVVPKDSYDFTVHKSEWTTFTATAFKPPFYKVLINRRETHKGKKIYCGRCLSRDHFHTNKRPCHLPIACPNCLSTDHKFAACTEPKICRECKSTSH